MSKPFQQKDYKQDIGKTIHSSTNQETGTITDVSSRYCAGCMVNSTCYIVTWSDGKKTKPCVHGCFTRPDGDIQIE